MFKQPVSLFFLQLNLDNLFIEESKIKNQLWRDPIKKLLICNKSPFIYAKLKRGIQYGRQIIEATRAKKI